MIAALVVLVLVGYFVYSQINEQKQTSEVEDSRAQIRNNITDYVTAEPNNYKHSDLGGIYGLVISIRNTTDYMLEDVRVELTYIKANGGVWKNRNLDFEMLSPQSVGTIKVPDTDRGVKVKVRVISVKSNVLDL